MKKVLIVLLFVSCFFALLLELTGIDPEKRFTVSGYVRYVSLNIEPLPVVAFDLKNIDSFETFTKNISKGFSSIWQFVKVVCNNIGVILYGFFPIDFANSFGGSGFGGGGGGAR